MKTKFKFSITFLLIVLFTYSLTANGSEKIPGPDPEKDKVLIYVLKNILTRGHFVMKEMNDDFSEIVYNSFIDGLDPSKRYFTQKDLKEFSKFKYDIDNQLLNDDVSFYNLVYSRFIDKVKNALSTLTGGQKQYFSVFNVNECSPEDISNQDDFLNVNEKCDHIIKENFVSGIVKKDTRLFLSWINEVVNVESFQVKTPTLEQIFIDEIRKSS